MNPFWMWSGAPEGERPLGTWLVSTWSMPGTVLGTGTKALNKTDTVPTSVKLGGSCDPAT